MLKRVFVVIIGLGLCCGIVGCGKDKVEMPKADSIEKAAPPEKGPQSEAPKPPE